MKPLISRSAVVARCLSLALLAAACDGLPGRDLPSGGDDTQNEDDPVGGRDGGSEPPEPDAGEPPVQPDDSGTPVDMDADTPPIEMDAAPPEPMNYVRVEAEDFLPGPDGYYDTTPENQGGYGDLLAGVDVGIANDWEDPGGLSVGYMRPGEWLRYDLELAETSAYTLRVRVAHETGGGQFSVFVDDRLLTTFEVPATGGWTTWMSIERPLGMLAAGLHALKVTVDSGGLNGADAGNVNYFDFVPIEGDGGLPEVDAGATDDASVPDDGIVRVETESFLPGPDGYYDSTPENQGGWGVLTEGVDVGFAGDPLTPGSLCIGYTRPGEWLRYDLVLRRTAEYTLRARVAHETGGGTFSVYIDDRLAGSFTVPSTGNWGIWTTVEQAIGPLEAGAHTLKLTVDTAGVNETDGGNVNYLEFVPGPAIDEDAGAPDAGQPDASAPETDAGVDAGGPSPELDAGSDASTSDAGLITVDAAT